MYISDLEIRNKFIHVQNIHMEFKQNGIYFILGENGCGKTTLLEQIIFGKEHVFFENPREKNLYEKERFNLFTYCPQKVVVNELTVRAYICKLNKSVREEQLQGYLQKFGFPEDILNQRFYTLSGGEQMKVSIISGLLKNTPYLFLDEPTNYLDNGAVKELVSVLEEEARKKRVIIVSHDSRLQFRKSCTYRFCNNRVQKVSEPCGTAGEAAAPEECQTEDPAPFGQNQLPGLRKMVGGLTKNFAYIAAFVIIVSLFFAMAVITNLGFNDSVDTSEFPEPGTIFAYNMGYHESLNAYYEGAEGLTVDEALYDRRLTLEDMETLTELDGVTDVYLTDTVYIDQLNSYLGFVPGEDYQPEEGFFVLSFPELLAENYFENCFLNICLKYVQGALPRDGAGEIAISKNLLIRDYGYNEETAEEAMGDVISVYDRYSGTERDYTVVGFPYYDIAVISFEPDKNYGVYRFDDATFEAFYEKMTAYSIERNMGNGVLENVLICVDKKSEREVLNYCFLNFPGCCYKSYYYSKTFAGRQIKESFSKWLWIHLVFSGIASLVVWIVNRSGIRYNMRLIWDIGNYYINRKKIMRYYIAVLLSEYLLVSAFCLIVNTALSQFAGRINIFILLDSVIILIPLTLSCIQAYRKALR